MNSIEQCVDVVLTRMKRNCQCADGDLVFTRLSKARAFIWCCCVMLYEVVPRIEARNFTSIER